MKMCWPRMTVGMLVVAACGGSEPNAQPAPAAPLVIPPLDAGASSATTYTTLPREPEPLPADPYVVARDPRARRPARATTAVMTEIQSLQLQLSQMSSTAPDRVGVLRKIIDDYAEVARNGAGVAGFDERAARFASTSNASTLIREHPTYPGLDEVRYYRALMLELNGDVKNARAGYFDLIKSHPESNLIGCAYYAFGEMFMEEAKTDPSKNDLARQAMKEALKYPPPHNSCHTLARDAMGRIGRP